ncbi:hypothetical protein RMSM_07170 [Rhodopirellula maiorica SM1]|uniref:Uncharacterized protein n=1 Tax=Rhodopirellula maiorica SM1 TaxID=1265738 RepID=M5R962_9BACT|nr:hypothetical protein RMSM_07170 [Rhodopirellula maiorica SM1]
MARIILQRLVFGRPVGFGTDVASLTGIPFCTMNTESENVR